MAKETHIHFNLDGNSYIKSEPSYTTDDNIYSSSKGVLAIAVKQNADNAQNTLKYTTDGNLWRDASSGGFSYTYVGNSNNAYDVAYGKGLWVAVGHTIPVVSTIQYSSNGSNWFTIATGGFKSWVDVTFFSGIGYSVAYGNGTWVVVGSGNSGISTIQYSRNGSNWSTIATGGFNARYGYGVTYGKNLWVAVGNANSAVSTIQYSSNASNWYPVNIGGFNGYYGYKIAYHNGLWLALASSDAPAVSSIQYSSNASNWYSGTNGLVATPSNISYITRKSLVKQGRKIKTVSKTLWIASGNPTQYSPDGSNWYNNEFATVTMK